MAKLIIEVDDRADMQEVIVGVEKALADMADSGTIAGYDPTADGFKLHMDFSQEG